MTTVINFMPAYEQAPVSLFLLKQDADAAASKLAQAGSDVAVFLPGEERELIDKLKAANAEAKVFGLDDSFGFLYGNDTAARQVLRGQKPIPSDVTGSLDDVKVVSGEQWLLGDAGRKYVWFEGADAPVQVPSKTTGAGLAKAGGMEAPKALYLGHPSGRFLSAASLGQELDVTCDYARLYDDSKCMANAVREICDKARNETCGRCVYGHEGSYQLDAMFNDICSKHGRHGDFDLVHDLCPAMRDECLCEVGRTLAATVESAVDQFSDEISAHFTKNQCPAGECRAYLTFHILVSRCTGCGKCLEACPEDAIAGKAKFVHVVDQKACTQCGRCQEVCPEGAVVTAGVKKPKTPPKPIPCRVKK